MSDLERRGNKGGKNKEKLKTGESRKIHGGKGREEKMTERQILRNKVRSSQARESACAALRWTGRPERGHQAENYSYLLPCTEDERTTGWVLWVRTWHLSLPLWLSSTHPASCWPGPALASKVS